MEGQGLQVGEGPEGAGVRSVRRLSGSSETEPGGAGPHTEDCRTVRSEQRSRWLGGQVASLSRCRMQLLCRVSALDCGVCRSLCVRANRSRGLVGMTASMCSGVGVNAASRRGFLACVNGWPNERAQRLTLMDSQASTGKTREFDDHDPSVDLPPEKCTNSAWRRPVENLEPQPAH